MSFADKLVQTPRREKSGETGYERYDYQACWGLALIFESHSELDDYAIAFEFHDDIVRLNSSSAPTLARFYQVKTKLSGHWTLTDLSKRKKSKDNLGPLRHLAGVWQADKGVDVNPKAAGPERRIFREHIRMEPIDPQANGPQVFYGLRYHIHINTPEEDITFHDQVGYWLWEPATGLILQSVTIPRGQVLLAAGRAKPDDKKISVTAERGDTRYGICSTEFLDEAFRTESYRCDITFNDDGSWTYLIETELLVKGRDVPFNHQDTNTLKLVGAAAPNPLAVILKDRAEKK